MSLTYNLKKVFIWFLVCHFLIWSLIPCLRQILPLDTLEAIVWGSLKEWGTNKHPPLSGVLAYAAWFLSGKSDIGLYILDQVCVITGFVFIYKIAKLFLSNEKAILATLLTASIHYYNFSAVEFNVNVVSLALWPITAHFFLKAVSKNKLCDWIFLGIFAGVNILNKYVCIVLFLSMVLYLLLTVNGRKKLFSFGPYITFIVCVLIVLPHFLWLYENDFFIIDYFMGRASSEPYKPINHIICPIRFLLNQLMFFLPALITYLIITFKAKKEKYHPRLELLFMAIVPILLTVLVSAILGTKLKTMWGFPLLYLSTVSLFYYMPRELNLNTTKRFVKVSYLFLILLALAYTAQIAFNKGKNFQTNPNEFIKSIKEQASQEIPQVRFDTVGGHTWWTSALFVYDKGTKNVLYHMSPNTNPWFDLGIINKTGMIVFTESEGSFTSYQKDFPRLLGPFTYHHKTKNWFGKDSIKKLYYGFIPGVQK